MVLGECLYGYRVHLKSTTRDNVVRRKRLVKEVYNRAFERRGLKKHLESEMKLTGELLRREQETGIVPHCMESVLDLRRVRQRWNALRTAMTCMLLHPRDPYYYKPLAYFLAPLALINYYRCKKGNLND